MPAFHSCRCHGPSLESVKLSVLNHLQHCTRRPHIQLRMQGSCVTLAHCTAPTSDAVMIAIWRSSSTSQCDQPRRVQPKLLYRCRNTVCGGIAVALSCFHQLCTNHHPAGLTLITRTPRLGQCTWCGKCDTGGAGEMLRQCVNVDVNAHSAGSFPHASPFHS